MLWEWLFSLPFTYHSRKWVLSTLFHCIQVTIYKTRCGFDKQFTCSLTVCFGMLLNTCFLFRYEIQQGINLILVWKTQSTHKMIWSISYPHHGTSKYSWKVFFKMHLNAFKGIDYVEPRNVHQERRFSPVYRRLRLNPDVHKIKVLQKKNSFVKFHFNYTNM